MADSYGTRAWVSAPALLLGVMGAMAAAMADAPADPAAPASPASPAAGSDWRATVRDFAAKHFKNPAWGYSHCRRDYALARELAAADHVTLDDDVLFAAAYLHDMAAFPPWEKAKLDHSDVAAGIVDTILKGTGFPMAKIDAVRAAIRTHMYYRDPVGPEALYLHDADALDWLGAIGVARIMALVDPNGGEPDGPKAVKMLDDNLKRVPEHVLSPAGRTLAGPRTAELEQFLRDLRSESENLRTL
ncbi:MAG TPA: HD domain-containing protein [Steroidobacteraceae bacterium]|nr:HD domain-containing protein [Steroidobacteraceae bacterium]